MFVTIYPSSDTIIREPVASPVEEPPKKEQVDLDDIDNSPLPLEIKVEILRELAEALEKYLEENRI